jgi:hypothetical protein
MKDNQNTTRNNVAIILIVLVIMLCVLISYKIYDNSKRYNKCLDSTKATQCDSCWLVTHNL